MRVDHVLYVTSDLDAAQRRVESELGVEVQPGGRHSGQGTHNRIVPLQGGYLELIAVHDPAEAEASPFGRLVAARVLHGDGLWAWAVTVTSAREQAARLGTEVFRVERDGFGADVTGVVEALSNPYLPFFISRDPGVPDPSAGGALELEWIQLGGRRQRFTDWTDGADLPVRFAEGPSEVQAIGVGGRAFT
jgi:hypothetical protein